MKQRNIVLMFYYLPSWCKLRKLNECVHWHCNECLFHYHVYLLIRFSWMYQKWQVYYSLNIELSDDAALSLMCWHFHFLGMTNIYFSLCTPPKVRQSMYNVCPLLVYYWSLNKTYYLMVPWGATCLLKYPVEKDYNISRFLVQKSAVKQQQLIC